MTKVQETANRVMGANDTYDRAKKFAKAMKACATVARKRFWDAVIAEIDYYDRMEGGEDVAETDRVLAAAEEVEAAKAAVRRAKDPIRQELRPELEIPEECQGPRCYLCGKVIDWEADGDTGYQEDFSGRPYHQVCMDHKLLWDRINQIDTCLDLLRSSCEKAGVVS